MGRFPMYAKPSGFKSRPLWSREDVIEHLRATFGHVAPELVERAAEELLSDD
jgi:hypothetical protein